MEQPFRPLVQSYGTTRYGDIDPTAFTVVSFVVMFGMMFGDVGHGLVLALLALWLRRRKRGRFAAFRSLWVIPFAAGLSGACFGLALRRGVRAHGPRADPLADPLDEPVTLLLVAVGIGAVLLTISYLLGIVNRWRRGGLAEALLAQFGVAGLTVFLGGLLLAGGVQAELIALELSGAVVAAIGLVLLATRARARGRAGRGGADAGLRSSSSTRSSASSRTSSRSRGSRPSASCTRRSGWSCSRPRAPSGAGPPASSRPRSCSSSATPWPSRSRRSSTGVQALRLEYYELYSRIFSGEGHAFAPWSMPVRSPEEAS